MKSSRGKLINLPTHLLQSVLVYQDKFAVFFNRKANKIRERVLSVHGLVTFCFLYSFFPYVVINNMHSRVDY